MRLQFQLGTLLWTIAYISITLAGSMAFLTRCRTPVDYRTAEMAGVFLVFLSPLWVPLVFAAYALGRRTLNAKIIVAYLAAEAVAFGGLIWTFEQF